MSQSLLNWPLLYKMFVRPKLEYCSFLFSNARKLDRFRIENVQRKFTKRIIGYNDKLSYSNRCDQLNLQPLWLRRLKMNLSCMYKIVHRASSRTSFAPPSHYGLRNNRNLLITMRSKSKLRSSFFLVKYRAVWNKLPEALRTCPSLPRFCKELDCFLRDSIAVGTCLFQQNIDTF